MSRSFMYGPLLDREKGYGAIIICGSCGARGERRQVSRDGRSSAPDEVIAKHFQSLGWRIGSTPRKDRCPDCVASAKSRKEPTMDTLGERLTAAHALRVAPGASEQPPREITREDRRLIFAKLEEVYLSEKVGYKPGWTDERVARDLDVPRKWVEVVRDENFGPQKTEESEEVVALRKALDAADEAMQAARRELADIARHAAEETKRVAAEAVGKCNAVEERINALAQTIERCRAGLAKLTGRA